MMRAAAAVLSRLAIVGFGPDDPIGVTALFGLEDETHDITIYFLVPCAAGETIELDGLAIRTLTPRSPLGQAVMGRHVDEEIALDLPGRRLVATVAWIC
jgi:transcription elongation GreA/GreB family factor